MGENPAEKTTHAPLLIEHLYSGELRRKSDVPEHIGSSSPAEEANAIAEESSEYRKQGAIGGNQVPMLRTTQTQGQSKTSGGIGKNDDSAKESAISAPRAEGLSAHESVQS